MKPNLNTVQADKMTFQSENSRLPHKKFGKNNHYPVVMSRLNEFWKTKSMHHDKSKNLPHANANMRSPNVSTQQYWTWLREFWVTTQATEDMNLIKYNLLDMARFSRINWVYSAKFEKVCTIFSFLWCARRGRWKRQFTIMNYSQINNWRIKILCSNYYSHY